MTKQSEAIADAITTWPEVIYLVSGCDETPDYKVVMRSGEVTWCVDKQADGDVQYVSAAMYEKLHAKLAAAEARTLKAVEAMRVECQQLAAAWRSDNTYRSIVAIDAAAIIAGSAA